MACLLVPAAEAVIATIAHKAVASKEGNSDNRPLSRSTIPWSRKIKWLCNMLWGGAALLAFEHIWHGEIVPWAPFLTAMRTAEGTAEMIREMTTVGIAMALLVTAVWCVMVAVAHAIEKRPAVGLSKGE